MFAQNSPTYGPPSLGSLPIGQSFQNVDIVVNATTAYAAGDCVGIAYSAISTVAVPGDTSSVLGYVPNTVAVADAAAANASVRTAKILAIVLRDTSAGNPMTVRIQGIVWAKVGTVAANDALVAGTKALAVVGSIGAVTDKMVVGRALTADASSYAYIIFDGIRGLGSAQTA